MSLSPKNAAHLYNFGLVLGDLNKLSEIRGGLPGGPAP